MDFDPEFLQVQQYLSKVNPELVILEQESYESEVELFEKMMLQIKIYGSKIIELYQSLDEICPTERQIEKINIIKKKNTNNNNNNNNNTNNNKNTNIINEIDYDQVWEALSKGFDNDIIKAMELLQQLDYNIHVNKDQFVQFIEYLQISNRYKDRELDRLCQLFPNQYPQTYFKQLNHLTNILQQYSQMIPILVQENEQLQCFVQQNKELSNQLLQMECQLNNLQNNTNFDQNMEISTLKHHLQNIEKQLNESNTQNFNQNGINNYYIDLNRLQKQQVESIQIQKYEELIRSQKKQLQEIQIEKEDLQFKLNTNKEELKNNQLQIQNLTESYDKMQNEYKKAIQKKNQIISELEGRFNLDNTQRSNKQIDLDQIEEKIQQFKNLYEQKIKHLQNLLHNSELENAKFKDVVRQSALEVDSLKIQIESVLSAKSNGNKILKNPKKQVSSEYLQLLSKYQEMVERNEQLNQQLYSQILDGSVLSHQNN